MIKRIQLITIMCLFVFVYNVYGNYENEIHYENRMDLIVKGPEIPAERISGRLTDTADSGDERFMHRENHTIRIVEETSGALLSLTEPVSFEIKIVQPGVHIVDAGIRGLIDNINIDSAFPQSTDWQSPEDINSPNFVSELTEFDGGSLRFTHKPLLNDYEKFYGLDIGLLLSVAAGFEHNHGGKIEAEVFRESVYIGTAHIANITDPIIIEHGTPTETTRGLGGVDLVHIADFNVIETAPGMLEAGSELWFYVMPMQQGRPIFISYLEVTLFIQEFETNEMESGLILEPIPRNEGNPPRFFEDDAINRAIGFRVVNPSSDIPGRILFFENYIARHLVVSVDFDIVVTGKCIESNNYRFLSDSSNHFQERAKIYDIGYNATIHRIIGLNVIMPEHDAASQSRCFPSARREFTESTMVNIDDGYIQAIAFQRVTPNKISSMINPRVFAEFIGAEVVWNESARTVVFTGDDMHGSSKTVTLTLNSPTIIVNGQAYDIAVRAGQSELEGQINPVVINGRTFVPARVLAEIFDIPINFVAGSVILG